MIRLLIATVLASSASLASAGSLLKPAADAAVPSVDEAFQLQPAIWKQGQLLIGIDIAPNCYLYRNRFSVEPVTPAGYALGAADLPPGEAHHDEHFGDVRIFHHELRASYHASKSGAPQQVRIRYQGCAENLVCYSPQERIVDVEALH